MDILLNFIPLKQGGGVQVGLDFLNQAKLFGKEHNWYVVATEGTPFVDYDYFDNVHLVKVIPSNLLDRLLFEYYGCKPLIKELNASIIYTQFGPIWPGANVVNVAGCAYSNLMYPEIDFWGELPFLSRIKRKIIDYFRIKRMVAADYIIYETKDLADRAVKLFSLPAARVFSVRPTASSLINLNSGEGEFSAIPQGFRILLLSHYRIHKNFEILPKVVEILKRKFQIDDVIFILTLKDDEKSLNIIEKAKALNVSENICNIGPVNYDACGSLYNACDAVILPSLLESFSNTIAEAWVMKKPLIISDFDWSRSMCGDAAIYITYDDAEDTALKIANLISNRAKIETVVEMGTRILNQYSDSKSRFLSYKKIIEKAVI